MTASLALLAAALTTLQGEQPTIDLSTPPPPEPPPPAVPALAVPRPAPAVSRPAVEDDRSNAASPRQRSFRSGLGAAQVVNAMGVSPTAAFGLEVAPWEALGLRLDAALVYGGSLGELNAIALEPQVVLRLGSATSRVLPYLGAGANLSLLSIDPAGPRGQPLPYVPPASTAGAKASRSGRASADGGRNGPADNGAGSSPAAYTASPELSAGASIRLTRTLALDVGGRYLMIPWKSTLRHGFAETATLCFGW